ncbi:MAG: hypothetical protein COZ06_26555 [Armatimonadetes bacterium CG_4_10_14_3_um_filter_66_18]|nr:hypothetical protein [Armatimonadota bacterium]OIP11803.1 MAG: hypothetical protein AUJ96_01660 [Armatimonadetes bacterium CG2_30_66_41]PIU94847.1 MAG: hypothetical protein COS65_05385 [Armatimonadetes bacterium CG06_land_8_20_14_3_00_66_21]PIX40059.1 MAG: hypothetical protein COZ57_26890 [Armatimonadetes bacterium CG_4_8_14_3_um_filter_66_20]PIY41474.1 MAG: hypothetical protein COZ06_26555 [Armatimonadetes bacterium CG_4_10_14_3_um_filter_66_18]PIZ40848.1 MAG: hypothetical protein COY42_20
MTLVPADLPPMAWSPPSERETPAFVDFESAEAEAGIRYSKYRGHRLADRPLVDREGARAIRMDPNAVKAFLYCGVDDSYVFYRRVRNRVEITVVAGADGQSSSSGSASRFCRRTSGLPHSGCLEERSGTN